jgi:gliding motility-associated-like protein
MPRLFKISISTAAFCKKAAVLFVFLSFVLPAQNLVRNPGFEDFNDTTYISVDSSMSFFPGVLYWSTPTFAQIGGLRSHLIESIINPVRPLHLVRPNTGNVSMAIGNGGAHNIGSSTKTFVQTQLEDSLQKNCYYKTSLYFLPIGVYFLLGLNEIQYYCNRLGAYVSKDRIRDTTGINESLGFVMREFARSHFVSQNIIPQFEIPDTVFFEDTLNYSYHEQIFKAEGGERYLTIGNFYPMSNTSFKSIRTGLTIHGVDSTHNNLAIYSTTMIDDVSIIAVPPPDSVLKISNDTIICPGEFVTLSATYPDATQWLWNTGETTSSISVNQPGSYRVDATCPCGFTISKTVEVTARDTFTSVEVLDTSICRGDNFSIAIPVGAQAFLNGNLVNQISISEAGEYSLVFLDDCKTDTIVFTVQLEECEPLLYVPNAFTPNGDGRNDVFRIQTTNIDHCSMYIYSRWGDLIHEVHGTDIYWDGTINGSPAPIGSYVYVLEYLPKNHIAPMVKRGNIHLYR